MICPLHALIDCLSLQPGRSCASDGALCTTNALTAAQGGAAGHTSGYICCMGPHDAGGHGGVRLWVRVHEGQGHLKSTVYPACWAAARIILFSSCMVDAAELTAGCSVHCMLQSLQNRIEHVGMHSCILPSTPTPRSFVPLLKLRTAYPSHLQAILVFIVMTVMTALPFPLCTQCELPHLGG